MAERQTRTKTELEEAEVVFTKEFASIQDQLIREVGVKDINSALMMIGGLNLDERQRRILQLYSRYNGELGRLDAIRFALGEEDLAANTIREYQELAKRSDNEIPEKERQWWREFRQRVAEKQSAEMQMPKYNPPPRMRW